MSTNTPGPWKAVPVDADGTAYDIDAWDAEDESSTTICRVIDDGLPGKDNEPVKANAEFIVRACNAHADLLAAMERAELELTQCRLAVDIGKKTMAKRVEFMKSQVERIGNDIRAAIDQATR